MACLQTWSMTSKPPAVVYLIVAYASHLATENHEFFAATNKVLTDTSYAFDKIIRDILDAA